MSIFSFVGKLFGKITKFIGEFFTDSSVRKYNKKLRDAKKNYYNKVYEINQLQKTRNKKRQILENERREVYHKYLTTQIEFNKNIVDILNEANKETYLNIKEIKANVKNNKKGRIPDLIYSDFKEQIDKLHLGIKIIKGFKNDLIEQRKLIEEKIELIPWDSKKVGSKKKILELIESNQMYLLKSYKGKNSEDEIDFKNYSFDLDSKCPYCKIKLNQIMKYCFNCGEIHIDNITTKYFKKYVTEEDYTCPACNAPLESEFRYCYNCGREHDPFEFTKNA